MPINPLAVLLKQKNLLETLNEVWITTVITIGPLVKKQKSI